MKIDYDGLQIAFLAWRIEHYLDLRTGDVVELREAESPLRQEVSGNPARYLRVPCRSDDSDVEDRRMFAEELEPSPLKQELSRTVDDPTAFRALVARDRMTERAWYNFKNERATEAIDTWLRENGVAADS